MDPARANCPSLSCTWILDLEEGNHCVAVDPDDPDRTPRDLPFGSVCDTYQRCEDVPSMFSCSQANRDCDHLSCIWKPQQDICSEYESGDSPGSISVYRTDQRFSGGLISDIHAQNKRAELNQLCFASRPQGVTCNYYTPLISISSLDSIANMPYNFGFNSEARVFGYDQGMRRGLAVSWNAFLNGEFINNDVASSVLGAPHTGVPWTGSDSAGNFASGLVCNSWTSSSQSASGATGAPLSGMWPGGGSASCDQQNHLVCVCVE